jgi:hypothetical protein
MPIKNPSGFVEPSSYRLFRFGSPQTLSTLGSHKDFLEMALGFLMGHYNAIPAGQRLILIPPDQGWFCLNVIWRQTRPTKIDIFENDCYVFWTKGTASMEALHECPQQDDNFESDTYLYTNGSSLSLVSLAAKARSRRSYSFQRFFTGRGCSNGFPAKSIMIYVAACRPKIEGSGPD